MAPSGRILLAVLLLSSLVDAAPAQIPLVQTHECKHNAPPVRLDIVSCAIPAYPAPGLHAQLRRTLKGRFLHITDMHPDPHYRKGASESSACHRKEPKKERPRAGYYGLPYR